jgi:hypothetical protein
VEWREKGGFTFAVAAFLTDPDQMNPTGAAVLKRLPSNSLQGNRCDHRRAMIRFRIEEERRQVAKEWSRRADLNR